MINVVVFAEYRAVDSTVPTFNTKTASSQVGIEAF